MQRPDIVRKISSFLCFLGQLVLEIDFEGRRECLKDNLLSIRLLRRFSITRGIFDEVIS